MAKKRAKRDTTRYVIVRPGVTSRPLRTRAAEHKRDGKTGVIYKVGPKVSRVSALTWEKQVGKAIGRPLVPTRPNGKPRKPREGYILEKKLRQADIDKIQ